MLRIRENERIGVLLVVFAVVLFQASVATAGTKETVAEIRSKVTVEQNYELDTEVELPSGANATVADLLALHRYLELQRMTGSQVGIVEPGDSTPRWIVADSPAAGYAHLRQSHGTGHHLSPRT